MSKSEMKKPQATLKEKRRIKQVKAMENQVKKQRKQKNNP